jgi:hypothetical protein
MIWNLKTSVPFSKALAYPLELTNSDTEELSFKKDLMSPDYRSITKGNIYILMSCFLRVLYLKAAIYSSRWQRSYLMSEITEVGWFIWKSIDDF